MRIGVNGAPFSLKNEEHSTISMESAEKILGLVSRYLQSYQPAFVTDVGQWEMQVEFIDGSEKSFNGPLIGRVSVDGIDLSDCIRREVPIGNLFAFDGGGSDCLLCQKKISSIRGNSR